jgi:monoamine oxidase
VHDSAAEPDEPQIDIAVVGGGISGLYCALQLARLITVDQRPLHIGGTLLDPATLQSVPVHLYESSGGLGGRIETWTVKFTPDPFGVRTVEHPYDDSARAEPRSGEYFRAEFGPMRIEPRDQPLLKNLLDHLGIVEPSTADESDYDLIAFPAYSAEEPLEPKFTLHGEEAEQSSLLDLLLLAVRRICELVAEEDQQIPATAGSEAARHWRRFLRGSSVRRRYWKGELRDWILTLENDDYDHIRRHIKINGVYLRDMGFWNLLSEVLSHLAVLRIRDWGSYYHLVSENPNAAEHLVMWLRSIKSTNSLRGIRGGMHLMVAELQKRLTPERGIQLHTGCTLINLEPVGDKVRLRFADGSSVVAREVVLALPQRPLAKLDLTPLRRDINAVVGIPLLKVFFIIDQPWWEDNRPSNRFAADLPTREIYYWKSKDRSKGVLMVYTDRPALQFWTDYLDAQVGDLTQNNEIIDPADNRRQEKATTWLLGADGARSEEQLPNRRLWQRFVQYARDYEHNDFTADRLIACGMRDWGREPYDGAVHVWRPRQKSWEVMSRMTAFGLVEGATNVHVCGDAYSDYQGFIEGALRSTARVLTFFMTGDANEPFNDRQFLEKLRLPSIDRTVKTE